MSVVNRMLLKPLVCSLKDIRRPPGSGQPSDLLRRAAKLVVYTSQISEDYYQAGPQKGPEKPIQHDS